MAYKFQLGAFVASGSITAEDGLDAGDSNITNVGDIALDSISADNDGDMEINVSDNSATSFVIKQGSDVYMRARTSNSSERVEFLKEISGSAALNLGGNLTMDTGTATIGEIVVGAGGLDLQNLSDTAIAVGSDSLVFKDADGFAKSDTIADLATAMAGNGLAASSGVFAVGVDDSSIELNSDALRVKAQGITNAMLADDAVGADELASNAVVNASVVDGALKADKLDIDGSTDIGADLVDADLMIVDDGAGGTNRKSALSRVKKYIYAAMSGDATASESGALTIANDAVEQAMIADDAVGADQLASNAVVNASVASNAAIAASKLDFNVDLGGDITFGNQSDDTISTTGHLTVGGNLTVNGSVTSVNSTTINITSSFTFEGPADDHETVLSSGTPGADTTITLPTLSAGSYFLPALADAATDASAAVTAAEFAILDGGSADSSVTIAAADQLILNDGGVMKQTSMGKFATYFASDGLKAAGNKLELDINSISADALTSVAQADLCVVSDDDGNISKKITFSNFEDTIFGNVSGDATIAAGGALTIANDAVESGMLNDNVISGQTELASGAAVDADEMLISDGGTLKKIGLDSLKVYMSDAAAVVQNVAAAGTLVVGVNYFSAMGADGEDAVTLPASPSVGQSVKVKAPSDCSTARYITINRAGSQLIDGAASIRLESPFAAVELVYVASDIWRVF